MKTKEHRKAQKITTLVVAGAAVAVISIEYVVPQFAPVGHIVTIFSSMVWIWIE